MISTLETGRGNFNNISRSMLCQTRTKDVYKDFCEERMLKHYHRNALFFEHDNAIPWLSLKNLRIT